VLKNIALRNTPSIKLGVLEPGLFLGGTENTFLS
jgi:hypothetical protein